MLHTHTLVTTLFLVAMLLTVIFSFGDKSKASPKWLRISHMVLGPLMLITGIYLMVKSPLGGEPYVWAKLILVLIATPLGIIGGRKKSVPLSVVAFLLVAGVMTLAYTRPSFGGKDLPNAEQLAEEMKEQEKSGELTEDAKNAKAIQIGESLYNQRLCQSCHGEDGAAGYQKAKNLQVSVLSDAEIGNIIVNGKGLMPANEGLSDAEVGYLTAYVKSLRK